MTISTTTNRVTYTGNGVTVAFSVPYAFFAKADLVVIETVIATGVQTTKALTTHYTIAGSVDALGHYSSGGTVTALTAPASTVTWTIYRDPTATQTTDLVENDPMPAESLEAALDYQTMLNQRTRDIAARSLQQPEGDSATIDRLPAKVARASKYLAFDADGDPVATAGTASSSVVTPFMETVLDDTTAASARATLDVPSTAEAILDTLIDAKGDLLVGTAADTVARLAVGANDQVLIADSAQAGGVKWGAVPAAAVPAASDAAAGAIEIAVQAEVATGSDTTRCVTPGRQHYHPSAAKAWVNFNGTGVVAIRSSYNVASITDNGSGDYTVNFSAALADANYCVSGVTTSGPAGVSVAIHAAAASSAPTVMTTTACRIYASNNGGAYDVQTATIVFHR